MTSRGASAPVVYRPRAYWEARARRYATQGDGLAAVCSYGMPEFYNRVIDIGQRLALAPWLKIPPGTKVLDVGCGIGRWSRLLAARGAEVTGIDLSPTMIEQATQRAERTGLGSHCHFLVQDTVTLEVGARFDLVLGVTVLQHILDADSLHSALSRMAAHLLPGGRMVLLEAAPVRFATRCDSSVFRARNRSEYLKLFEECGLRVHAVTGVDPAPFKAWLLPHLPRLPRPLRTFTLAVATALSAPADLIFGRVATNRSWHAVFVLEHAHRGDQDAR